MLELAKLRGVHLRWGIFLHHILGHAIEVPLVMFVVFHLLALLFVSLRLSQLMFVCHDIDGSDLLMKVHFDMGLGLWLDQDQSELHRSLLHDLLSFDHGSEAGLRMIHHEDAWVRLKKLYGLFHGQIRVDHSVGEVLSVAEVRFGSVSSALLGQK